MYTNVGGYIFNERRFFFFIVSDFLLIFVIYILCLFPQYPVSIDNFQKDKIDTVVRPMLTLMQQEDNFNSSV